MTKPEYIEIFQREVDPDAMQQCVMEFYDYDIMRLIIHTIWVHDWYEFFSRQMSELHPGVEFYPI